MTDRNDTHVFTGEWLQTSDPDCTHRYRTGFAGMSAGSCNGWAVFRVTPRVMAAIVDNHHAEMTRIINRYVAAGRHLDQAWLDCLHHMASLSWLGPLVVVDHRIRHQDPTLVEVIAPDETGRYQVGFGWCWYAVRPVDVHTLHRGGDQPRSTIRAS